jgi:acyl carrier protein
MTQQEILSGFSAIVEEIAEVPAADVQPDKSFVDDLDIDSLTMVEISVVVQDTYGIELPDSELKSMKTVQDVLSYIERSGLPA